MAARTISIPLLIINFFFLQTISSLEFTINSFNSSSVLLYGNASIESSALTLTSDVEYSIGRALYPDPIPTRHPNSSLLLAFSTSFIFSISTFPNRLPGHGFAFLFAPTTGINGTNSVQHLGLLNFTNDGNPSNHVFAVEFDVFMNQEFSDINDNHVGVNVNSLTSRAANEAGYWINDEDGNLEFRELKLNDGENYQVWIDYSDLQVNVTMAPAGIRKPNRPLINASIDLSDVLLDRMYVGFAAATGLLVQSHRILSWAFSNSNFSVGDSLITTNLPSFGTQDSSSFFKSTGFVAGISVGGAMLVLVIALINVLLEKRRKRGNVEGEELEKWEVEYWPHRIDFQEIHTATNGFSEQNVIGYGGNGKVYKGVFAGGVEVAVKCILLGTEHKMGEFLSEISSLGRLKHRNLVGLRGWCKNEKQRLILVYDYMANGSLDKWLFGCEESTVLNWEQRIKSLKDVASGMLYLHEGWEARVLHRDLKASNVLLDRDMNARLGDFGLARMHNHGELANTTRVVGTVGYMAPELIRTGRASAQTDVFGFGLLILEVVCGRRPIEEGKPELIPWVYGLMEKGNVTDAIDEMLKNKGGYDEKEVENVLLLGLLCVNPQPKLRPSMRLVLKALENTTGGTEFEGEEMEASLLDNLGSNIMGHNSYQNNVSGYPTYQDIDLSHFSSSISFVASAIIKEGR